MITSDTLIRTDSTNPDFISLVRLLDAELHHRYGEQQSYFNQFNKLNVIKHVVVAYQNNIAVGCGAFKKYNDTSVEIKRMFVKSDLRSKGIVGMVLRELEKWAVELGFSSCILETGNKLPEAVRLYKKSGYSIIPNYDQYIGIADSVCMKKMLIV